MLGQRENTCDRAGDRHLMAGFDLSVFTSPGAVLDHVAALNDRHTARGHSGKFVTVYPNCDGEAHHASAQLSATSPDPGRTRRTTLGT
jgi:hypothetical protein